VLEVSTDVRRESEVVEKEGPTGLVAPLEWSEPIRGEPESHIAAISKEFVLLLDPIDDYVFAAQFLEMRSVIYVLDDVGIVFVLVRPIFQFIDHGCIFVESFETRDEGNVRETVARLSLTVSTRFVTCWAGIQVRVVPNKADTSLDTTVVQHWLECGQKRSSRLGNFE
jgi:hypothetical protein